MDLYLREAFMELYSDDGLLVMARGLGILRLLAKFLRLYSKESEKKLVFCINLAGDEEAIKNLLLSDGVAADDFPKVIFVLCYRDFGI